MGDIAGTAAATAAEGTAGTGLGGKSCWDVGFSYKQQETSGDRNSQTGGRERINGYI